MKFFLRSRSPSRTLHSKFFQKMLILAFEANNSALSSQNGLFSAFISSLFIHCKLAIAAAIFFGACEKMDKKIMSPIKCISVVAGHCDQYYISSIKRMCWACTLALFGGYNWRQKNVISLLTKAGCETETYSTFFREIEVNF